MTKHLIYIPGIIVCYFLIGFLLTFIIGDNNFFEELAINPSDAFFVVYAWPALILMILLGGPG